jgi:phenylalanyl-tRNA synthetase beta chain
LSRAKGAAGTVHIEVAGNRTAIGDIGLFTDALQKQYDLRHVAAGAEVDWDVLLEIFQPVRRGSPLPKFPGVDRDLSVVVDETVRWADVESALNSAKLDHLQRIDFVGTFRNKQIGAGKKSLTLSLSFRDPSATLRSEQVDGQVASVVKILGEKFAATLRA